MDTAKVKTGRVACVVPFCRRTKAAENLAPDSEWICGNHWRLVDRRRRRVYSRMTKRLSRDWSAAETSRQRLWSRLKCEAIERAAGIA